MIRATRNRSRRPNHMDNPKGKEKPLSPAGSGWVPVICIASGAPKWRLGRPQAPSGAQLGGPKRLQASTWPSKASLRGQLEGPKPLKMLWQASQMLQRRSQDAPRDSQDALKTVQEAPKTTQEAAKMLSEASAWLLRCSKRLQEAPGGSRRHPRGLE